ncbi:serine hydrolase [Herpetosiphon llansteffanensis]
MKKAFLLFWVTMLSILACGIAIYYLPATEAVTPSNSHPERTAATPSEFDAPPTLSMLSPSEWVFPDRAKIGSIEIGGLNEDQALAALQAAYPNATLSLTNPALLAPIKLSMQQLGYQHDFGQALLDARDLADKQIPVRLAINSRFDQQLLDQEFAKIEQAIAISPTVAYDRERSAFVLTPGLNLDRTALLAEISQTLQLSQTLLIPTQVVTNNLQANPEQLTAAFAEREAEWDGIFGISVYDIKSDQWYDYRGDTVFSGMSVLKIPILLQSFISRKEFTDDQYAMIDLMIGDSDNEASNDLLAMIGDGDGLEGAKILDQTLTNILGLEYTTLAAPFESIDYLSLVQGIEVQKRGQEGAQPYTNADPYVRSSPREMAQVVLAIFECSQGHGVLLEVEDTLLNVERCNEIIEILSRNRDTNKIVAGVPEGSYVAHKSGWVEDARADAGYVRDPNGDEYIVSMWIWQDTDFIETPVSDPLLADISRIIYTARHPQIR